MSEHFIGIDYGTCNSSMAWFNPNTGHAETLLNAEGEDKTPSVVFFGDKVTLVGKHAEERLEHPEDRKRVIIAAKRELAKTRVWMMGAKCITPVIAAAEILKKLKKDAEKGHFHDAVLRRAVITYPAVFDEVEKDKLREAATLAGFREIELTQEPLAAAIAYSKNTEKVGRYVLVYDLGGGTFDLALLARDDGDESFRLAMESRGDRVGGEDFDRAIYDHFEKKVFEDRKQPISLDGLDLDLLRQCRKWKETLSVSEEPSPFSYRLSSLRCFVKYPLTRKIFERLVQKDIERTIQLTRGLTRDAAEAGHRVDSVILIGGSSRVPLITRQLREILQIEPCKWHKRDVAVALGAVYYAHELWGRKRPQPPLPDNGPQGPATAGPSSASREQNPEAQQLLSRARNLLEDARMQSGQARIQKLSDSLNFAQAACDLESNWAESFYVKGEILLEKEEWILASATFTACLQRKANFENAFAARGYCKLMASDFAGAKVDLNESIARWPKWDWRAYEWRANASARLGDADAAVHDLQKALVLADPETPTAILKSIIGFILLDKTPLPERAIPWLDSALEAFAVEPDSQEKARFASYCRDFGFADRVSTEVGGVPIAPLQRATWQACKSVHGGCTRIAVSAFCAANQHVIHDSVWYSEPDFALHRASLWAESGDASRAVRWLKKLLHRVPTLNIRVAMRDPWISGLRDRRLEDFLAPKLSHSAAFGAYIEQLGDNHLTVTNESVFCLHSIRVVLTILRTDKSKESLHYELDELGAGQEQRWDNVFRDPGWFTRNIEEVTVVATCAEASQWALVPGDEHD